MSPLEQHALIANFSAQLAVRRDAVRVRHILAGAFIDHVHDLWPLDVPAGAAAAIPDCVDALLATIERLYAAALGDGEAVPVGQKYLDRMAWLPALVEAIDVEGG